MTRSEFLTRFPHATEAVICANCSDYMAVRPPSPQPIPDRTAAGKEPRKGKRSRVPRTRNAATWTEAEFWSRLRSCMRRMSIYWKPARIALHAARIPFHGPHGQRWAFLCADCNKLFKRRQVELDHIIPAGKLTSYDHIGLFLERLLPEDPSAYRIRCLKCHQKKTNAERAGPRVTSV